eukprot:1159462-Pelagomonas_calceolata.AAC.9
MQHNFMCSSTSKCLPSSSTSMFTHQRAVASSSSVQRQHKTLVHLDGPLDMQQHLHVYQSAYRSSSSSSITP